ncbi:MAG TPA: anti-sigma factor, partial [Pseudomonas sp.]|nr:anti-sigma factor [Pseudomonas sp.]
TLSAEQIGAVQAGQLFELTLEPEGGSPLNRPTGPVLYIGRAVLTASN